MDMTQIFMDEIEKVAQIGGPGARTLRQSGLVNPKARSMAAKHLLETRRTQGPAEGRIELAALRGAQQEGYGAKGPRSMASLLKARKADPVSGSERMTTQALKETARGQ